MARTRIGRDSDGTGETSELGHDAKPPRGRDGHHRRRPGDAGAECMYKSGGHGATDASATPRDAPVAVSHGSCEAAAALLVSLRFDHAGPMPLDTPVIPLPPTRESMSKRLLVSTGLAAISVGCSGVQSSLDPGGTQAERIAALYWWMAGGASLIWLGVIALAGWCYWTSNGGQSRRRDRALIVGGGVVFPIAVLTALLAYGLAEIPPLVARAPCQVLLWA
jgi:hypothetical protein